MPKLFIERIRIDGDTQPRVSLNEEHVAQLVADLRDGAVFPPLFVCSSGRDYWLFDGFHRIEAYRRFGAKEVKATVEDGDRRQAFLRALEVNNGMPLLLADRKAAAEKMLRDTDWATQSDRWIGRKCGIDGETVGKLRRAGKLSAENRQMKEPVVTERKSKMSQPENNDGADVIPLHRKPEPEEKPKKRKVVRAGKTYEIDTSQIGKLGHESKGKPKHLSTKAWTMLKSTPVSGDNNQKRQLSRLAPKMQLQIARMIQDGDAGTVMAAITAITQGAPVDDWARAYEAVMKLTIDDRRRLCRMVLSDLDSATA